VALRRRADDPTLETRLEFYDAEGFWNPNLSVSP
jgi:hypothetical protein